MNRFPGGAAEPGFWHKQLPDHAPDWIPAGTTRRPSADKTTTYLVVDDPAALVWAANFGALEWHAWTARTDSQRLPSYVLIDIDPGSATSWNEVLLLARLHRTALEHLGVRAQPKLTGRRGIQIWVPIARGPGFDETRAWAEQLSRAIGAVTPELVSWKWDVQRAGRPGPARLHPERPQQDPRRALQHSCRSRRAGVRADQWDELDDPALAPDAFTIRTILDRVAEKGDLFRTVLAADQTLPPIS